MLVDCAFQFVMHAVLQGAGCHGGFGIAVLACCRCRSCIAAFVDAVLQGGTQPGVWFPEEPEAVRDRMRLLQQSSKGCIRFELNQPPWAIESDAKQMGMGFYW